MSLSFYIPHRKTWFSNRILKVGEVLPLIPKLQTFPDRSSDKQFFGSTLDKHDSLLFGIHKQSGRGFELSFEKDPNGKDSYRVRFLTPSTINDWKTGLRFIRELAKKCNSKIISEYGEPFTTEDIEDYPYTKDIELGISAYFSPTEDPNTGKCTESNLSTYFIPGLYRTVAINREIQKKIMGSPNPAEAFSKFYNEVQYETSFRATQKFYKDENQELFGNYVLTEGVDTVLPFEPFVEFENRGIASDKEIGTWKLSIVCHEGDPDDYDAYSLLTVVDYREFMRHLPKDAYEWIDAVYVVVFEMTKKEIEAVLGKMKNQ